MTILQFLQNIGVAIGLGCAIGLERQVTGHSIGIRTGVLVCIGASLFTSFAYFVPDGDVSRMAAQIISGVGFLGSGIIFKDGSNVRGINTAATIWCTAGIGVMAGAGLYLYAALATGCLVAVNLALRFLSRRMVHWQITDDSGGVFRLSLAGSQENESEVRKKITTLLSEKKNYLFSLDCKKIPDQAMLFEAKFVYGGKDYVENNERIASEMLNLESVRDVKWNVLS
ncbi:MAG: MgtC/SapB family protein [Monoglobales bacterium]